MTNDFTIKLARHQSPSFATWSGCSLSIWYIFSFSANILSITCGSTLTHNLTCVLNSNCSLIRTVWSILCISKRTWRGTILNSMSIVHWLLNTQKWIYYFKGILDDLILKQLHVWEFCLPIYAHRVQVMSVVVRREHRITENWICEPSEH